jgi:hypothetical protein
LDSGLRLLVGGGVTARDRKLRLILFVAWLALVSWFLSRHVLWRDEMRAFSLALSGSNLVEMFHHVHGEGHPLLWYLILRIGHDIFPYREVLPAAGFLISIAAMAVLTWTAPFRTIVIALILFSFYGAFEFAVIARNYGISMLVMFALAALYGRVRNTLWFGYIILILCNTNVPSCIIAAGFMLFRFVELLTDKERPTRRDFLVFAGNALLALLGAYLCFRTVYPTFNDAAVSRNLSDLSIANVGRGLIDNEWGFSHLAFGTSVPFPLDAILLAVSCIGLIRRPAALAAGLVTLIALKLFFYFVYYSYYRHEILYVIFLISLYWMVAEGAGGRWRQPKWQDTVQFVGTAVFAGLLVLQCSGLLAPIHIEFVGVPFSHSAQVGALLKRPEFSNAIVTGDPDTMLEPVAYYADNPIWFLRQQRFGRVVSLSKNDRHLLSMTDMLADAEKLHRQTGRPVVILSHLQLQDKRVQKSRVMFGDATILRPDEVRHFWASTRLVAKLRPSASDEDYDVYVYPR